MRLYVLTGGPCSGKSLLIEEFSRRGYTTVSETAREVLTEYPKEALHPRQKKIAARQREKEERLRGDGICFLDRGMYDGHGYCMEALGRVPEDIASVFPPKRYDLVFLLDQFPLEKDGLRIEEDEEEGKRIHRLIAEAYEKAGYEPVKVPRMPVAERAAFILDAIKTF